MTTYDSVNRPKHYNSHPSGIECIEITRHMNFNRGNAVKYIWRAGASNDKDIEIQDIQKAIWYLNDEVKRLKGSTEPTKHGEIEFPPEIEPLRQFIYDD